MHIIDVSISNLIPYENNPRLNAEAVGKVAASIKEFGFKVPLVIDANNVIVCGHTRYKAAKALGLASVPCVVADDLTEEQIKAYRLADNKVAEFAKWDFEALEHELDSLSLDMSALGFDIPEDALDDVPDILDLPRTEPSGTTSANVVRFNEKKIYLTEAENERLLKFFDAYTDAKGVSYGLFAELLEHGAKRYEN